MTYIYPCPVSGVLCRCRSKNHWTLCFWSFSAWGKEHRGATAPAAPTPNTRPTSRPWRSVCFLDCSHVTAPRVSQQHTAVCVVDAQWFRARPLSLLCQWSGVVGGDTGRPRQESSRQQLKKLSFHWLWLLVNESMEVMPHKCLILIPICSNPFIAKWKNEILAISSHMCWSKERLVSNITTFLAVLQRRKYRQHRQCSCK